MPKAEWFWQHRGRQGLSPDSVSVPALTLPGYDR